MIIIQVKNFHHRIIVINKNINYEKNHKTYRI
jgi:hypothetical protein